MRDGRIGLNGPMTEHVSVSRLEGPLAIVGVTIIPMGVPGSIGDQTVVIESGRITALGPASQVDTTNMKIVEAKGKTLLPGLADMHVHYWEEAESAMYLANGVTTVRNMWGSPFHKAMEAKVERGETPGPRIITTSPLIDGLNEAGRTLWRGSNYVDDKARADRFVRRYAEQGFKQIKVYSLLNHELLTALGNAAKDNGVTLVGHCPNPMKFEEAIDAGMTCFEHLTNIFFGHFIEGVSIPTGERAWDPEGQVQIYRTVAEGADMDAMGRLADLIAERGVWNCPTITVWQGGLRGPEDLSDRRFAYLYPWVAGWWSGRGSVDAELQKMKAKAVEKRLEVLSILRESGARVLVGTDNPNPFCFQGFSLHDEIDNFIGAGYSPQEVLKAATADAAAFVGESDDWGTISVGKRADLVMVDGDPLRDVSVLRQPVAVFANGYHLTKDDLAEMLAERSRAVKKMPEVAEVHVDHERGARHLTERTFGVAVAKVCCNAMPQPGGSMLIDEERADSDGARTRRRIFLGPDKRLERAEQTITNALGEETFMIERTADGYRATTKTVDGSVNESKVTNEAVYPSDVFGFTALAEAVSEVRGSLVFDALTIDHQELQVIKVSVEAKEDGEISFKFQRKGTPTEVALVVDQEGQVTKMLSSDYSPKELIADD